jgi:hypothetical protein
MLDFDGAHNDWSRRDGAVDLASHYHLVPRFSCIFMTACQMDFSTTGTFAI